VLPTHTTFGFCGPRFLVMGFPRTVILALEPCGIATLATPHFIEKPQVDVGAPVLQLGESVTIDFFLEIRSPLEPFESPDSFIDSLVHQVQRFQTDVLSSWQESFRLHRGRTSGFRLLPALRVGLLLPFLFSLDAFLFVGY